MTTLFFQKYSTMIIALSVIGLCIFSSNINAVGITHPSIQLFDGNIFYVGGNGPGNYSNIQTAINDAQNGDTVFVYNDSSPYLEVVTITKQINLIGEDTYSTVIDGESSDSSVSIMTDNVTLMGFTIQGNKGGVKSMASNNITIIGNIIHSDTEYCIAFFDSSNNIVSDNSLLGFGLYVESSYQNIIVNNTVNGKHLIYIEDESNIAIVTPNIAGQVILINCDSIAIMNQNLTSTMIGIVILNTNHCLISNNSIWSNLMYGIYMDRSSGNTISNNIISSNNLGIRLSHSDDNTFIGNIISNHDYGLAVDYSDANIISKNTISYNYHGIVFWYSNDNIVTDSRLENNWDAIEIAYASRNTIINNTLLLNSHDGIYLADANQNTITGNTICLNQPYGIGIVGSGSNLVTLNNISNNEFGIWVHTSNNNNIYHNNLINNTHNSYDDSSNCWNDTYPSGGNYWSDYMGEDHFSEPDQNHPGPDGIGDSPYSIEGGNNQDKYPLINPYGSHFPKITIEISRSKIIIKNIGEMDIYDILWSVNITGGFFNLIHKFFQGSVDVLHPGDNIIKEIPIFFGLGPFEIYVNGTSSNLKSFSTTAQGFVIIFFILLK